MTLDYDDYLLANDSADAVANHKLDLQFVVLAYAVAPEFVELDFQVLPHDSDRHVNLAEFHFVAHDSFANGQWNDCKYFSGNEMIVFYSKFYAHLMILINIHLI